MVALLGLQPLTVDAELLTDGAYGLLRRIVFSGFQFTKTGNGNSDSIRELSQRHVLFISDSLDSEIHTFTSYTVIIRHLMSIINEKVGIKLN